MSTTALDNPAGNIHQLLQQHFEFAAFRPGQREVIEALMSGHSAAAVFPTGGGKSLCYQLPAVALDGVTIVVSPLIALMKDQIDALRARGIAAVRLDSSLSLDEYVRAQQQLRAGDVKLLYVSPERFNNERFRELLMQLNVALFAVDEAHCISEWGHNFRPDYLKLVRFARMCQAQRCLALTATATETVLDDICKEFLIQPEHAFRTPFYRNNLDIKSIEVDDKSRDEVLCQRLGARPPGATIVYVTLQKTAETVAAILASRGYAARAYHAGMDDDIRAETQEWFLGSSHGIIVATIAFGMGIDKADIRYIYHYNLSKSIENFAQEIGRSGRDGETAICETLFCWDDLRTLENFVHGDTPTAGSIKALVDDIFSRGQQFAVSMYQLAREHDIRDLVVRTLLTYLEVDGYIEGGTPHYAEYQFVPRVGSQEILNHFQGERREFVSAILSRSRQAKKWFHLDVDQVASATGADRARVVRALDYLADQDWIELKAGKLHHRFTRLKSPSSNEGLASELTQRVQLRQQKGIARLDQLVGLLTANECQASALASYFGETLVGPCGHCGVCLGERAEFAAPKPETTFKMSEVHLQQLNQLRAQHPALTDTEVAARFLCGISSPAITKAKLHRDPLFGSLSDVSFSAIVAALS